VGRGSATDAPGEPFAFRSEGYAWLVVFMLFLAGFVSALDRQIINLLVDPIRNDLGITDTQISLLQGFAFAVFYSIVAIPLGRLADASNRKVIIAVGMVLWSIATTLCGLAKVFSQLFVARMLVGIGEATLGPAGLSMVSDYFPRKRVTRALSVLNGSVFLGSGIALIIGGLVIDRMLAIGPIDLGVFGLIRPWQMTFLVVSVPGLILVGVLWWVVREPPRTGPVGSEIQEPLSLRQAWTYLVDHRTVLGPVIFGFTFLATMMFSLGAWVPTYFIRTHGMTASEIGGIVGLYFMLFGAAGVICGGLLSDWLRSRGYHDSNMRAGLVSALVSLPFVVAFPLVSDQTLSLTLFAPVIFFGTMPFGTGPAALPLIVPNRLRGQLIAVYLLFGNLIGQGAGPWLVAVFTDFVLGDPNLIRYSISCVCSMTILIGATTLFAGLKPYRVHIQAMEADHT
jgi:MFS family permease